MNCRRISVKEWRWVVLFSQFVMVITIAPYLRAWMSQGTDWEFTGFLIGVEDGNSYIAKMLTGAKGEWLFRSPYTFEAQEGAIVFLPYLLFGRVDLLSDQHTNLVLIFHIYRLIGIFLLCIATYEFFSIFVSSVSLRKWALVFSSFGGGLGWLLLLLGQQNWLGSVPLDFYSPESFGFLSIFGIPHLVVSRALLLFGISAFLRKRSSLAGIYLFLLGFFQPVTVLIGWIVLFTYTGFMIFMEYIGKDGFHVLGREDWQLVLRRVTTVVMISSPMVIYSSIIFWIDPYLRTWKWGGQNTITSPHPFHYVLGYGIVISILIPRLKGILQKMDRESMLLISWLVIAPFLIYLPVDFQRRLADGIWVILVVTMMKGLEVAGRRISPAIMAALFLTLLSSSTIYAGAWSAAGNVTKPLFLPRSEVEAFSFLNGIAPKGSVVACSYQTGNALPAWAAVRVVVGHGPETINLLHNLDMVRSLYDLPISDNQRQEMLRGWNASFVVHGPDERSLGEWNPGTSPFLKLLFQNDEYAIYTFSPHGS